MTTLPACEEVKTEIDAYLALRIEDQITAAEKLGERYVHMWQRVRDVTLGGGKRLRPYLAVVGYGGTLDQRIMPVAAAQELVHVAMLMHDDIIDEDFVRHGLNNMSGFYRDEYSQAVNSADATRHANSVAIIAGDALISEAYLLVAGADFEASVKERLMRRLGQSIFEVIGGELLDVEASFLHDAHHYDPEVIYRYKTASYSFIGPLLSGAIAAGVSEEQQEILKRFGEALGIAYQIQDDILGVFGDEDITGKTVIGDLQEGKRTMLIEAHQSAMDEAMRERFKSFGCIDASVDSLNTIKQDIVQSGALEATISKAEQYFAEAERQLGNIQSQTQRHDLGELMAVLRQRRR